MASSFASVAVSSSLAGGGGHCPGALDMVTIGLAGALPQRLGLKTGGGAFLGLKTGGGAFSGLKTGGGALSRPGGDGTFVGSGGGAFLARPGEAGALSRPVGSGGGGFLTRCVVGSGSGGGGGDVDFRRESWGPDGDIDFALLSLDAVAIALLALTSACHR